MMPFGHPSYERLSRYADQDLDDARRRRVAQHLAGCSACRARVRFIRELDAAARSLSVPAPDTDLLERVIDARQAGERAILPTADPVPPRLSARRVAGIAALAVFTIVSVAMLVSVRRLSADHSTMHLSPDHPTVGQSVRIDYRSGGLFSGLKTLRVRARYRDADGHIDQGTVATITLGPDGAYHGVVRLPGATRYAAFAVENPGGTLVDSNNHELWSLMVCDGAGRPLPGALDQQTQDLVGRDWPRAFASAREYTRLYPRDPEAWRQRFALERQVTEAPQRDSLVQAYRVRFQRFDRELADARDLPTPQVQGMYFLSRALGTTRQKEFWQQRLLTEHPRSRVSIALRTAMLASRYGKQPRQLLDHLEQFWTVLDHPPASLTVQGLIAANQTGDRAAVRHWIRRFEPRTIEDLVWLGSRFSRDPAARPAVLYALSRFRESLQDEAQRRPLYRSVPEQARDDRVAKQMALAEIGKVLIAAGDRRAAADSLDLALSGVWDPQLFRTVADARLEMGDTTQAIPVLARIAADPLTGPAFTDSVLARYGDHVDVASWEKHVRTARDELIADVMDRSVDIPVPGRLTITDARGSLVNLRRTLRDSVTLVAFWSRHVGVAARNLPGLQHAAEQLRSRGVRTVVIASDPASAAFRRYAAAHHLPGRILHDVNGAAAHAFQRWSSIEYFLVDVNGRIRFRNVALRDALREAVVLKLVPRDRVVAVRP